MKLEAVAVSSCLLSCLGPGSLWATGIASHYTPGQIATAGNFLGALGAFDQGMPPGMTWASLSDAERLDFIGQRMPALDEMLAISQQGAGLAQEGAHQDPQALQRAAWAELSGPALLGRSPGPATIMDEQPYRPRYVAERVWLDAEQAVTERAARQSEAYLRELRAAQGDRAQVLEQIQRLGRFAQYNEYYLNRRAPDAVRNINQAILTAMRADGLDPEAVLSKLPGKVQGALKNLLARQGPQEGASPERAVGKDARPSDPETQARLSPALALGQTINDVQVQDAPAPLAAPLSQQDLGVLGDILRSHADRSPVARVHEEVAPDGVTYFIREAELGGESHPILTRTAPETERVEVGEQTVTHQVLSRKDGQWVSKPQPVRAVSYREVVKAPGRWVAHPDKTEARLSPDGNSMTVTIKRTGEALTLERRGTRGPAGRQEDYSHWSVPTTLAPLQKLARILESNLGGDGRLSVQPGPGGQGRAGPDRIIQIRSWSGGTYNVLSLYPDGGLYPDPDENVQIQLSPDGRSARLVLLDGEARVFRLREAEASPEKWAVPKGARGLKAVADILEDNLGRDIHEGLVSVPRGLGRLGPGGRQALRIRASSGRNYDVLMLLSGGGITVPKDVFIQVSPDGRSARLVLPNHEVVVLRREP